MWFGWPVKHFKQWIDDTIWEQKNRLKSVRIKLFSEYLQITNVFVEIRIVSRMIHELQNGQISNKHYLQWIIQSVIDIRKFSRICDSLQKCWVAFSFSAFWLENMLFSCKLHFVWVANLNSILQTVVLPFLSLQGFFSHIHWQ